MRIKMLQRPSVASIDGLRLDHFEPGFVYDVGTMLGMLLLAERWAEPVINVELTTPVPLPETEPSVHQKGDLPSNLVREKHAYTDRVGIAADFQYRKRSSQNRR